MSQGEYNQRNIELNDARYKLLKLRIDRGDASYRYLLVGLLVAMVLIGGAWQKINDRLNALEAKPAAVQPKEGDK